MQMYRAPFLYLPGAPNSQNPPHKGRFRIQQRGERRSREWCVMFFFATAMVRIQMIEAVNSYTLGFGPHVGESGASIGAH